MKKITFVLLLFFGTNSFAQFTTGVVNLTASRTIQIDTDATTVTMTLTGSNTSWLGIGFNGNSMSTVTDMFIWNSSASRDYTPSGFQSTPSADASQSWNIVSDNVVSTTRTIVATRPLVSAGDFTFLNSTASIPIIYNQGTSTVLAYHGGASERGARTLTRTALGVEDFSLNATQIYPNPSSGNFMVKTKTGLDKINVYTQAGAFVKTVKINNSNAAEINVKGLSSGIYLLELINASGKSWKKIKIN